MERRVRRVERITRLAYGNLVLEETRTPAPPSEAAARVLVEAALAAGPERFAEPEALEQWRTRVALLAKAFPEAGFPTVDDAFLRDALASLCVGARSFSDLEGVSLLDALYARLTSEQQRLLANHAPERVTLPGGRGVKVHYEPGKPPWVESRLQDFFGMAQGPSVGAGRVPLVLHLLAPNMRAVQVTTDLAGLLGASLPGDPQGAVPEVPPALAGPRILATPSRPRPVLPGADSAAATTGACASPGGRCRASSKTAPTGS